MKSVTIPKSVTTIGDCAFGYNYDYETGAKYRNSITLYVYKDTAGETYAIENELKYVEIDDSDTPTPTKTLYHGNIDGDEKITSGDSLKALRASVGLENLNKEEKYFADVNGNGNIDSADSLAILRFSVGLVDSGVTIGFNE